MKKELIICTLLLAMLAGCQSNTASPSNHNDHEIQAQSQQQQVKPQAKQNNDQETILHFEELAKGIEGVKAARVVIIGKTAIIGIDVDPYLERSRVGTIKYSVSEAIRNDPGSYQAIVTADVDLGQRITEIREDIVAGKPIQGFVEELADIVGRIVPQIPSDLIPAQKEYETNSTNKKGKYVKPEQLIDENEQRIKGK